MREARNGRNSRQPGSHRTAAVRVVMAGGELFFVAAISTSSAAIVTSRSASSSARDSDSSELDVINKLRTHTSAVAYSLADHGRRLGQLPPV